MYRLIYTDIYRYLLTEYDLVIPLRHTCRNIFSFPVLKDCKAGSNMSQSALRRAVRKQIYPVSTIRSHEQGIKADDLSESDWIVSGSPSVWSGVGKAFVNRRGSKSSSFRRRGGCGSDQGQRRGGAGKGCGEGGRRSGMSLMKGILALGVMKCRWRGGLRFEISLMLFSQYEACISFSEKTMKKRYSQIVYPQKLKTQTFILFYLIFLSILISVSVGKREYK